MPFVATVFFLFVTMIVGPSVALALPFGSQSDRLVLVLFIVLGVVGLGVMAYFARRSLQNKNICEIDRASKSFKVRRRHDGRTTTSLSGVVPPFVVYLVDTTLWLDLTKTRASRRGYAAMLLAGKTPFVLAFDASPDRAQEMAEETLAMCGLSDVPIVMSERMAVGFGVW